MFFIFIFGHIIGNSILNYTKYVFLIIQLLFLFFLKGKQWHELYLKINHGVNDIIGKVPYFINLY